MKRIILLVLVFVLHGCITSRGGADSMQIGSATVFSSMLYDAKQGDKKANSLWCHTLSRVHAALGAPDVNMTKDEGLVEATIEDINQIARELGYRLHRQQLRQLILDAKAVAADPKALAGENEACLNPKW